ncbi:MAG: hypothetical protein ACT4PE_00395 [Candidatus Eiseniibacteriota bacterium]
MNPQNVRSPFACALIAAAVVLGGCGDDSGTTPNPDDQIDTTPPAVPVNLAVAGSPQAANITVAWDDNAEADLAGYVLERSLDRGATWTAVTVSPLSDASYEDSYYPRADYRVAAVDLSDNQSAFSGARAWIYTRHNGPKIPAQPVQP